MRKATNVAVALSTMLVLATFGFAGSAVADDKDQADELVNDVFGLGEDKKDKEHKNDKKIKYIALGLLGDVAVSCPGINNIDTITVHDPTGDDLDPDGDLATIDFYVPGKDSPSGDVNVPLSTGINTGLFRDEDPDLCLGGAIGAYTTPDPNPDPMVVNPIAWDIWISDAVWENVEQVLKSDDLDLDLKTAGLARMVAEYESDLQEKGDPGTTSDCDTTVPDLEICIQDGVGSTSHSRNVNQFGFCGQGYIEDATNPWEVIEAGPGNDKTDKTVSKVVFVDSLAFYQFDCANEDLFGEVEPLYNQIVGTINDPDGPGGLPGTCDDDPTVIPNLVCFFDFPVNPSQCFNDKQQPDNPQHQNIAVPGILGTIGWNHDVDETKCDIETPTNGDWSSFAPGGIPSVVIKETPDPIPDDTVPTLITIEFE